MAIALFDLDETLIAGDSDYEWGRFLVSRGIVDGADYERRNREFYADYRAGSLDIYAFLEFALAPLAQHNTEQLYQWRRQFIDERIKPLVLADAIELLNKHRNAGDYLVIITSTNRFVTEPIAELFNVHRLLATEPQMINNQYTGKVTGTPCFSHGKVICLQNWLLEESFTLESSYFYTDSHNDIPLLEKVSHPVAIDPDDKLKSYAQQHGWPCMSLRKNKNSKIRT